MSNDFNFKVVANKADFIASNGVLFLANDDGSATLTCNETGEGCLIPCCTLGTARGEAVVIFHFRREDHLDESTLERILNHHMVSTYEQYWLE